MIASPERIGTMIASLTPAARRAARCSGGPVLVVTKIVDFV
jgi:hypothetical protein